MTDPTTYPPRALQELLDLISDQPGAILYRGPNRWEAVTPNNIGDQLTLSADLLPVWLPPS